MPVHPQAQEVLDLLEQFGVTQLSDLSVEDARNLIVTMVADRPGPDVADVRDAEHPWSGRRHPDPLLPAGRYVPYRSAAGASSSSMVADG